MKHIEKRVAMVTSEALAGLHEDDRLLVAALDQIGIASVPAVWSDGRIEWASFDALVIRSPWDYFRRAAEFRAWLDARIADGSRLINPHEVIQWNFDKRYLLDMARAGVPIVPTIWIERGEAADIPCLARARGWNEIVIKPAIAGGSYGCERFRVEDFDRYAAAIEQMLRDRGLLVQPFLPEILADGELSLLFFDGAFSHAVRKRPKAGDYRVQPQFGGTCEDARVGAETIEQARTCLNIAPAATVYARVDGLMLDGEFVLIELEVFEPLMFLSRHADAAVRFARAIEKHLASPRV